MNQLAHKHTVKVGAGNELVTLLPLGRAKLAGWRAGTGVSWQAEHLFVQNLVSQVFTEPSLLPTRDTKEDVVQRLKLDAVAQVDLILEAFEVSYAAADAACYSTLSDDLVIIPYPGQVYCACGDLAVFIPYDWPAGPGGFVDGNAWTCAKPRWVGCKKFASLDLNNPPFCRCTGPLQGAPAVRSAVPLRAVRAQVALVNSPSSANYGRFFAVCPFKPFDASFGLEGPGRPHCSFWYILNERRVRGRVPAAMFWEQAAGASGSQ